MKQRHDDRSGERSQHPDRHANKPPHYAGAPDSDALYDGLPSVTNREWGRDRGNDDASRDQGGYLESQGTHAQSGHGRGGTDFDGQQRDSRLSRGPRDAGHRGRGPSGYVRPDDRIVDDIIDRLTDAPHIDASEVLVMVEDGEVTLTGDVPERGMKREAENLAAEAAGVRDVRNRIRVDDGSQSAGPPGAAVRSGRDQTGSGFSSSDRSDPVYNRMARDADWPGRNWPGQ